MSTSRTRNRLKMKRFVVDVQELWLTNLEHLKEHNPKYLFTSPVKPSTDKIGGTKLFSLEEEGDPTKTGSDKGNSGLANRRDKKAIESMQSQIQSVSQKRAFEKAYHTTRLPPVMVSHHE